MSDISLNDRLDDLAEKSRVMSNHLVNLSNSLGIFLGLQEVLKVANVGGPGSHALTLIAFDALHLIAIRTHSFLIKSNHPDDVNVGLFKNALEQREIQRALIDRCIREDLKRDAKSKIDRTIMNIELLDAETRKRLRTVRNKMLAHTTGATITDFPDVPLVINISEKSLEIGQDIYEFFALASFDYSRSTETARRSAQHIVQLMRDQPDEVRRRSCVDGSRIASGELSF